MAIRGAVLTGGRSKRFGSNKALASVGNSVMAKVAVSALRSAGIDPVVLVGGDSAVSVAAGTPLISDRWPDLGPLGGWATALQWAKGPRAETGHVLVCPCDVPLLSAEIAVRLVAAARPATAAVATVDERPNAIFGLWPIEWADDAVAAVRSGKRRMHDALDLGEWVGVSFSAAELADADTPADLRRIVRSITPESKIPHQEISERTD